MSKTIDNFRVRQLELGTPRGLPKPPQNFVTMINGAGFPVMVDLAKVTSVVSNTLLTVTLNMNDGTSVVVRDTLINVNNMLYNMLLITL